MSLKSLKSFFQMHSLTLAHAHTHDGERESDKESHSLHTCTPQICKGSCALTVCQSQSNMVNKAKPVKRKPIRLRP